MNDRYGTASTVSREGTKQDASPPTTMMGVDRSIWTDRMLVALDNGVKGRKWLTLIDKVYRPSTLAGAWLQVYRNHGAAGVDQQSVSRFAAQAERYLEKLQVDVMAGRYRPQPVRRVEIPKGNGKTRPLGIPPPFPRRRRSGYALPTSTSEGLGFLILIVA